MFGIMDIMTANTSRESLSFDDNIVKEYFPVSTVVPAGHLSKTSRCPFFIAINRPVAYIAFYRQNSFSRSLILTGMHAARSIKSI